MALAKQDPAYKATKAAIDGKVYFSNADIHVLIRDRLLQQIETGTGGHGRSDADHTAVLLTELDKGLPKHLAVARGLGFRRGNRLTGTEIKGRLGVIANLIGLGVGVALALFGDHMHQHRATLTVSRLEGAHHFTDVMAIDWPHVGEAQFLEDSTHLGNREATHAPLEAVEFLSLIHI